MAGLFFLAALGMFGMFVLITASTYATQKHAYKSRELLEEIRDLLRPDSHRP